uniref:RRM domain-containing protein n=1 Tax=Seriola lalandi dorsalis TaxID=1841481 RepID=A0A3B4WP86_SERLL
LTTGTTACTESSEKTLTGFPSENMVNESDLRHFFSQHGVVKEVKIITDRLGVSKGYGFVTFETEEDAMKILHNVSTTSHKSILIKSVHVASPDPAMPLPMSCGSLSLTTSTGYPYTYHNGVAYFHCPNMNPPPSPPVILPQSQPVYQQPAYHHNQCVPNQYQWTVAQSPIPSSPVMYSQQPEHLYQPVDGSCVQPSLPVMEDPTTEPTVQQLYQVYPQRTEGMAPIVLPHDPGKVKGTFYYI